MPGTNPFRHDAARNRYQSDSNTRGTYAALGGPPYPILHTDSPLAQKGKNKTVRIISPTSTISMKDLGVIQALSPAASSLNPSPSSDPDSDHDFEEDESLLDPFEVDSDENGSSDDESLLRNTQDNSGSDRSKVLLRAKTPLNPFPSIPASDRQGSNVAGDKLTGESHKRPARHYDVDSFTRLLLTGEGSSPRGSTSTSETYNGNSTNATSSAPIPTLTGPPPNSSQHFSQNSQRSSSNDDRQGLAYKLGGGINSIRPATSWHHHEETLERTSQKTALSQDLPYPPSGSTTSPVEPTSSSTPSSPVNLNKPLPPPPIASRSNALPSDDKGTSADVNVRENISSNHADSSGSDPALPLIFRYSSLTKLNPLVVTHERPTSELVNRSEELHASSVGLPPSSPKQPRPPLPPPRRQGRARGISASSTSSAISGASASNMSSSVDESSLKPVKQQPPIPPVRTPSNSSMTRPTRRSTHPDSPSTIPPPVPPQRRNSSRGSHNKAGQSTQYLPSRQEKDLWAFWASNPDEASQGQKLPRTDVLAGLSELQREVDELRGKIRG